MRSRKEIEKEWKESDSIVGIPLEVLLDIRDCQQKIINMMIKAGLRQSER